MPNSCARRTQELRKLLRSESLDAVVITNPPDWYYLTGFTGEAGVLIVSQRHLTLVTDGRFPVQAAEELPGVTVVEQKEGVYGSCSQLLNTPPPLKAPSHPNQLPAQSLPLLTQPA